MGVRINPPPAPMSVPNAPMSTPTGNNHRYGVMRPPMTQQVIRSFRCLRGRGNDEQGSKQMIVHSRGLCKSPTSPHGVEKHGQNRVRYATVWRQYIVLLVPSKERI